MTATTTTPTTAAQPTTATVVRRAAVAEWRRLTTLRSTWWTMLGAAAYMVMMAVVGGIDFAGDSEPVWLVGELAIVPGQFLFLLVVLLAVTGEYATGSILSSLQWVPHRGVLLLVRVVVPVAAMTAAAVLLSAGADLLAGAIAGDAVVVAADVARSLGTIALVVAIGGLLTVGIALLLRSTAGTLTATFLLLLVLPAMLPAFEVSWLTTVAERLPGHATITLLPAMEVDRPPTAAVTVSTLVTWLSLTTVAGAWSLFGRDARA